MFVLCWVLVSFVGALEISFEIWCCVEAMVDGRFGVGVAVL